MGKFFDSEIQGLPVGLMDSPEGEFRRQSELRLKAEEIFIRWQASERLSRGFELEGSLITQGILCFTGGLLNLGARVKNTKQGPMGVTPVRQESWRWRSGMMKRETPGIAR